MGNIYPTVLIPFNFDFESKAALDFALKHVSDYHYTLVLLHVIERSEKLAELFVKDNVSLLVEEKLRSLVREAEKTDGVNVKIVVRTGKPYKEILNVVEEYGVDFILMGTREHEEKAISNPKLGSVAGKIIRLSPIPVITFREGNLSFIKNILLPLDFAKRIRQKVVNAIRIAKAFNATIHVISIVWKKKEKISRRSLQLMKKTIEQIESEGISTRSAFISTEGGGKKMFLIEVIKYADNNNIDLIMIMTQSERPLVKYFISASAFSIVRKSSTPVLTITPKYVESDFD
jgi:nucleotide-binding universal stress UspA family protein